MFFLSLKILQPHNFGSRKNHKSEVSMIQVSQNSKNQWVLRVKN